LFLCDFSKGNLPESKECRLAFHGECVEAEPLIEMPFCCSLCRASHPTEVAKVEIEAREALEREKIQKGKGRAFPLAAFSPNPADKKKRGIDQTKLAQGKTGVKTRGAGKKL
jgi:hypothetical protein